MNFIDRNLFYVEKEYNKIKKITTKNQVVYFLQIT
jgi:hypothetical protein